MATKTIQITRIFDAPRERVWEAWTNPDQIKGWWGPKGFTAPAAKVDLRVGGLYHYCMCGPAGSEWDKDMWSGGEFKEIIPLEKLVMTDRFEDAEGNEMSPADMGMPGDWSEEMVVTVLFEDAGEGKTKLTIVHEGHAAELAEMAEAGWNESLDKFAAVL